MFINIRRYNRLHHAQPINIIHITWRARNFHNLLVSNIVLALQNGEIVVSSWMEIEMGDKIQQVASMLEEASKLLREGKNLY